MATYLIETRYSAGAQACVKLPDGVTWGDIHDWYVKWDTLFYRLTDDADYTQVYLDSSTEDMIDWKRPAEITVFPCNDLGHYDPTTPIATA